MTLEVAFVGLVVAALFTELTGLYPGGIIVPAYLALFVDQPLRLAGTVIAALLAWATYRLIERAFILFGHRRFLLLVLLGGAWAWVGSRVVPLAWPESLALRAVGWMIPGLIANTFERQGFWVTAAAMTIAAGLTYFAVRLIAWL